MRQLGIATRTVMMQNTNAAVRQPETTKVLKQPLKKEHNQSGEAKSTERQTEGQSGGQTDRQTGRRSSGYLACKFNTDPIHWYPPGVASTIRVCTSVCVWRRSDRPLAACARCIYDECALIDLGGAGEVETPTCRSFQPNCKINAKWI